MIWLQRGRGKPDLNISCRTCMGTWTTLLSLQAPASTKCYIVQYKPAGDNHILCMQGAPLAYTPFCDNNREMEGFRFWKQGFWKDHLRGRPYHISALYVVDLLRFRCGAPA